MVHSYGSGPGLTSIHPPSERACLKSPTSTKLKFYELLKGGEEALFSPSDISQPCSPDPLRYFSDSLKVGILGSSGGFTLKRRAPFREHRKLSAADRAPR